jgi:hypothetical protein
MPISWGWISPSRCLRPGGNCSRTRVSPIEGELRTGDITSFDTELPQRPDIVSCNLAMHHLAAEDLAVRCLEAIRWVRERTGCGVYIFDLARLRNAPSWPAMMSLADVPGPVFMRDGIASERAAFTFAELTGLIGLSGLGDLRHARAGPLGEFQLHWAQGRDADPPGQWQDVQLPLDARLASGIILRSFPRALARASRSRIPRVIPDPCECDRTVSARASPPTASTSTPAFANCRCRRITEPAGGSLGVALPSRRRRMEYSPRRGWERRQQPLSVRRRVGRRERCGGCEAPC